MPFAEWRLLEQHQREGLEALLEQGKPDRSIQLESYLEKSLMLLHYPWTFARFRKEMYQRGWSSAMSAFTAEEIPMQCRTRITTALVRNEEKLPPELVGRIPYVASLMNAFCLYPYITESSIISPRDEVVAVATSYPAHPTNLSRPAMTGGDPITYVMGVEQVLDELLAAGVVKEDRLDTYPPTRYMYMTNKADEYLR